MNTLITNMTGTGTEMRDKTKQKCTDSEWLCTSEWCKGVKYKYNCVRDKVCDQHQREVQWRQEILQSDKSFTELIMEFGSIDKCSCELYMFAEKLRNACVER